MNAGSFSNKSVSISPVYIVRRIEKVLINMREIMKEANPIKVSVIIPVYNTEKYLRECLDSIVNQTLREIEIICVDDGSTDGSLEILLEYEHRDPRIRVFTQPNKNAGAARNNGFRYATGEYLSFLDSDDYFEPQMLEMAYLKAKNQIAEIVVFRSDSFDMNSNSYKELGYTIRRENLPDHEPFAGIEVKKDFFQTFVGWAWDKIFLRRYIEEKNLRFQEQRTTNDMFFTFMAMVEANRITTIEDVLAHHRTNVRTSLEATRTKSWDCFYHALLALRKGLIDAGLFSHFEQDFINYSLHFSLWNLNRMKEPEREELFNILKHEWFQELGLIGYSKRKLYHALEAVQFQLILRFSYDSLVMNMFDLFWQRINLVKSVARMILNSKRPASLRGERLKKIEKKMNHKEFNSTFEQVKSNVRLWYYSCMTIISPELNTKVRFRKMNGYTPNLKNPVSFAEKICWLKLYRYAKDPLVWQCADKLAVRDYVRSCGFDDMLNPLYAVYDKAEDIDWNHLPEKCVLKWNFGCGYNILVEGKHDIECSEMIKKLSTWRKKKYWNYYSEMHYKHIAPKLICERFLDTAPGEELIDYKLYTFSGKVRAILVIARQAGEPQRAVFMTPRWEYLSDIPNKYPVCFVPSKPKSLERMILAAEKLSAPFPFVRVDFYEYEDKPVFGEMTFTPSTGLNPSECMVEGKTMGEMLEDSFFTF